MRKHTKDFYKQVSPCDLSLILASGMRSGWKLWRYTTRRSLRRCDDGLLRRRVMQVRRTAVNKETAIHSQEFPIFDQKESLT